ncbi:MAG: UBX domain-containing protein 7, partial [Paramarteilia canceri]
SFRGNLFENSEWMYKPSCADIILSDNFEVSKMIAEKGNKWVFTAILDSKIFQSHAFLRDHLNNSKFIEFLKEYFVVFCTVANFNQGKKLLNLYEPKNLPFIAIIDPKTGKVKLKLDPMVDLSSDFADMKSFISRRKTPEPNYNSKEEEED